MIFNRIVDVWIEGEEDADLLCELATVIGSLVQGMLPTNLLKEYPYIIIGVPEAVDQLIQCGGLILLLKGRICYFKFNAVMLS